jgi:hypothetical protein
MCSLIVGCSSSPASQPEADLFLVFQLAADIDARVVDQLVVEVEGPGEDWLPGVTALADEFPWADVPGKDLFRLELSGEFFLEQSLEVAPNVEEVDVPIVALPDDETMMVRASAYWLDGDDESLLISYTAARIEFPRPSAYPHHVVVLGCDRVWKATCLTGCPGTAPACSETEPCLGTSDECVEGCCLPQQ